MTAVTILLVLAAIALVLAIGELLARVFLPKIGGYYVWSPGLRQVMTTDPEAVPDLERVVRFETNADGERGGPVPSDWRDTYRILVAGGSVVECWFMDQPSAWPLVIERCLNEPERLARLGVSRVHVGSIGRSLVTCEHVDRALQKILPRYPRLDTIVFMVGASDLVHWLQQGAPPGHGRGPIPLDAIFAQHPEGPFGWKPRDLALWRIVSNFQRRLGRKVQVREHGGRSLARSRAARAEAKEILRTVPDPGPMLDRFERDLTRLLVRARGKASRVLLARQPWFDKAFGPEDLPRLWMFGTGKGPSGYPERYFAHELVWDLMRQIDARASKVASSLGVEQLDLQEVVPPSFESWCDELHLNADGCERVGRRIAEHLAG